jgi:trehalose/maltose hydrolase-like predicted phosphorylase
VERRAHYPGIYAHDAYNRETTIMSGKPVLNEGLVNLPNWAVLKLRVGLQEVIGLDDVQLMSYRCDYDIRAATVARVLRFRERLGARPRCAAVAS